MAAKRLPRGPAAAAAARAARLPIKTAQEYFKIDEFEEFDAPAMEPVSPASAPPPPPPPVPAAPKNPAPVSPVKLAAALRAPVNMDIRKLSKAQLTKVAAWNGSHRDRLVNEYFRNQMLGQRRKFGSLSVIVGAPHDTVLVGIECPFALQYLLSHDALPLGLIYHINGLPGSLKSALLYDIFRLFRDAGGGSHLEENESKLNPPFMQSIVGYADDEVSVIVDKCQSLEDWQARLTYNINADQAVLTGDKKKGEAGPGRTIPECFGVDSIMGKASQETQETVLEAGFAGRSHPIEALSINMYMKTIPRLIDGWPFIIVLNNHLKKGKDARGRDTKRTAGGESVKFQESFELETTVVKQKIECEKCTGVVISIHCAKNSFGPGHRRVNARLLWEEEQQPDGTWRQLTVWDWHWSTVHLLTTLESREAQQLRKKGVHLAAPKTSDFVNLAWSKNLGMKESDAVTWSEVGKMISENQEMMGLIYDALAIRRIPRLSGDYQHQIVQETEKAI